MPKATVGTIFCVPLLVWALSTTLFMLSLYVYCILHCKLTKKYLFQWKKTSFIVICSGNKTRNENKETKQDSFLMFWCCFLLFCLSYFFLWPFLDSSCESICLCSFCKKQKQKRFCVKGWGMGNNSCRGSWWFCYGAPQNCKCWRLVRSPSH